MYAIENNDDNVDSTYNNINNNLNNNNNIYDGNNPSHRQSTPTASTTTTTNDHNNGNNNVRNKPHAWFALQISTGHLLNLTTTDVEAFQKGGTFVNYLWGAPLESLVILYFGLDQVGISFLAGFAALALMVPAQV